MLRAAFLTHYEQGLGQEQMTAGSTPKMREAELLQGRNALRKIAYR